jgi:hypothetical protein
VKKNRVEASRVIVIRRCSGEGGKLTRPARDDVPTQRERKPDLSLDYRRLWRSYAIQVSQCAEMLEVEFCGVRCRGYGEETGKDKLPERLVQQIP